MGRFDANPIPSSCSDLFLGTSRTKYIDEGQVQGFVHSYRGAKLLDLCDVINQYQNKKLNTVVVIARFNDNRSNIESVIEHWKFLIQRIIVNFSPKNSVVPKVIPVSCNRLIIKKISALNYALYNFINSCALKLFIVPTSFRNVAKPNLFCKDTVHFFFHVFTIILFNIVQNFKYRCCYYAPVINSTQSPSVQPCPLLAGSLTGERTHCPLSKVPLRSSGVCCHTCYKFFHVKCSGLATAKHWTENFSRKSCSEVTAATKTATATPATHNVLTVSDTAPTDPAISHAPERSFAAPSDIFGTISNIIRR